MRLRSRSIPSVGMSVEESKRGTKRNTKNVNNGGMQVAHSRLNDQIEPQKEVNNRPKRDVELPKRLEDFYVETELKFSRLKLKNQNNQSKVQEMSALVNRVPEMELDKLPGVGSDKRRYTRKNNNDGGSRGIGIQNSVVGLGEKGMLDSRVRLGKICLFPFNQKDVKKVKRFNYINVKGDPNDDQCNICGDSGDLVCCDSCPSTFHPTCLDIESFPEGQWHCVYCLCKYCGDLQANRRCDALTSKMVSCSLCEEKFHRSCVKGKKVVDKDSGNLSFCGSKCHEIYEKLETLIGLKMDLDDGFSCTLLKRYDLRQDSTPLKIKCKSKLPIAFNIMDECFLPSVDARTQTNMIKNVVYNRGSNFRRLDYSRFFTAILEWNNEMISVATIRVHGNKLAEMPFIGTREKFRSKGMCRRLLYAIELILSSLGVGELIIPSIPDLSRTWTMFGFKPIEDSMKQKTKSMSIVVIPGTQMLQKHISKFGNKNLGRVRELRRTPKISFGLGPRQTQGSDSNQSHEFIW